MKIKIVSVLLMVILLLPYAVAAQTSNGNPCTTGGKLGECMSQIYLWSIGLSGLLAVAVFVWGAFLLMTSRGNGAQTTNGKQYMYSALLGLLLLAGAFILLNTLNSDLTKFEGLDLKSLESGKPRE